MPVVTTLKTVKIKDPEDGEGFIVINATDFDKSKHELYEESAEEKAAAKLKPPPPPSWDYSKLIPAAAARKLKDSAYATPESFIEATEDQLMNLGLGRQTVTLLKEAAAKEIAERIVIQERAAALLALSARPQESAPPPKKEKEKEKGSSKKKAEEPPPSGGPDDPQ